MSKEQFRAERLYLMSLSVARSMLQKGVISENEYAEIDTILLKKYRPVLGTLLAGKPLNSAFMTGGQSDGKGDHDTCYCKQTHSSANKRQKKAQGCRLCPSQHRP